MVGWTGRSRCADVAFIVVSFILAFLHSRGMHAAYWRQCAPLAQSISTACTMGKIQFQLQTVLNGGTRCCREDLFFFVLRAFVGRGTIILN
jgi:hypothetical protein